MNAVPTLAGVGVAEPGQVVSGRTWTETSPVIAPQASLTERARAEICRRVGQDAASVAAVARHRLVEAAGG